MSGPRPPLTDARLDRLLDRWLTEGPESVPDRVPEAALLTVSTTRQKGSRGFMNRFAPDRPVARLFAGLSAAAILAVVGFGIWRSTDVSVDPTPSPLPSSTPVAPTPVPTPFTLDSYSYQALGWEISLPANWAPLSAEGLPVSYRRFVGAGEPAGVLEVTLGSADGTVDTCILGQCLLHTIQTVSDVDALMGAGGANPFVSGPTSGTVDGEDAGRYSVLNLDNINGPREEYVIALHDGRPLFVHYHQLAGEENYPLSRILSALWFIDPTVLVPFESADGYRLSLPDTWQAGAPDECPAWQTYSGQRTPYGSLAVSYGDSAGVFYTRTASPTECVENQATTLHELQAAIVGDGGLFGMRVTNERETTLGGETAITFTGTQFLASAAARYVLAFHDGRPIALRFEFSDPSVDPALIDEIMASFQFTP
jgi:hypothetical protein